MKDIVDLLRADGYGVVEGADEVRKKIKEIGSETKTDTRREIPIDVAHSMA